jgi:hypothetical protein
MLPLQLYLLLVRVVPNTPIPVYINMFTTVLKTYTLILSSYFFFVMAFAYSFYLIFSPQAYEAGVIVTENVTTTTTTTTTTLGQLCLGHFHVIAFSTTQFYKLAFANCIQLDQNIFDQTT